MLPADAELPPNTIIHLPPAARRSIGETGGLVILVMIGLIILWMAVGVAQKPDPPIVINAPTRPEPAHDAAIPASPVIVHVESVVEFPTPSPWPTPDATLTPSPTPSTNYCHERITQPGETCTIMAPPLPTPTPLSSCDNALVGVGDRCIWPYPTPTSTPPSVKEIFT